MDQLTRRRLLAGGVPALGLGAAALHGAIGQPTATATAAAAAPGRAGDHGGGTAGHGGHASFRGGEVDHEANGFDPHEIVRDFDYGKTSKLPDGRTLREWTLSASEQEVEVAPGIKFPAWSFNGRIPGPTLRATEGDRLRIRFVNGGRHPHTMHFHGIHTAAMDGVAGLGAGEIAPGEETVYEFDAEPFGLHLYHCHVRPLAEHIAKGMYGTFIVDPKAGRPEADELVMVMNGFDTNFDRANEVYAVNTIGFAYMNRPIQVVRDELVRVYLVNALEYDLINSFHLHGNFFDYFPTGTSLKPTEFTDTVMQCQGQRGILEMRFPHTGKFMFHAHQSEFAELGWMSFFEVCEPGNRDALCRIEPRKEP
ncbi:MAG: multicopper oxidase domain-containing protein [Solirubrobacterales bacterium]|nr:multicopper oxidase domain-containing protein [Solirubrobacterales bacterium]